MEDFNEDIQSACGILKKGGIILYPTDTIWGIGCDATNEEAVQRVFNLKRRADHKAMLVLIDSPAKLNTYVSEVPDMAWGLTELTEKPLTIIYPGGKNLAHSLLGEDHSIGIRITNELFSQKLCERFRKPLVSTSANISERPSPSSFDEISEEVKRGVDYIVRYRRNEKVKSKPSGIIRLGIDNSIQIVRK
ncbi:MAG: threonylcarbamoyl-AMP synthase [Tannerella sp.]|jgi:L-threonylcarbamoyladenylate synthase|nr:threonylcarbamoyl-AMP synthase [Tannerella sp.]